jgi:ATP-dependent DNA helicase RecQ
VVAADSVAGCRYGGLTSPWRFSITSHVRSRATELLAELTGATAFRSDQFEAISALVADRRQVLVVQRTGWGKSAVYFIATRLLREQGAGPTLLVSPLLALMRDQIGAAVRMGLRAETINSTNRDEWERIFGLITAGEVDLLLISPERLNNEDFRSRALGPLLASIGMLVVDEAHCMSDWGHDFRPDYRRIGRVVAGLPEGMPVLCTTATANDRVTDDIVEQLGEELVVIRGPLDRPSLALQVIAMPSPVDRLAWLAARIPAMDGSGIVYCLTVGDAHMVAEFLTSRGIAALAYTGQDDDSERLAVEDALKANTVKVVVATSALGMGYDKPDLSFVIHYQSPGTPIAYYQQVGRAGRALDRAHGVLLSGREDRAIQDFFIDTAFPREEDVDVILHTIASADDGLKPTALERTVNLSRTRIAATLKVLEVEGALERRSGSWYRTGEAWVYPHARLAAVTAARRSEQEAMRDYIHGQGCLMEKLRLRLNDPAAAPCGRCASCTSAAFPLDIDQELAETAAEFLGRRHLVIEPRLRWPVGISGELPGLKEGRLEPGVVLGREGDAVFGDLIAAGIESGRFDDTLISALARMIRTELAGRNIRWLTVVPSKSGSTLELGRRVAETLRLEFRPLVTTTGTARPQAEMQNSVQQVENLLGAFHVTGRPPVQPGILLDDTVDSRWTLTMVGALLRAAGSGPLHPAALVQVG